MCFEFNQSMYNIILNWASEKWGPMAMMALTNSIVKHDVAEWSMIFHYNIISILFAI